MNTLLETERLFLREIDWTDLPVVHAIHSMPEVDEFNALGIPSCLEDTKLVLEPIIRDQKMHPRTQFAWMICTTSPTVTIGLAGLTLSGDRFHSGEIYYKLAPEHWGRGYATEAAGAIVQFGFTELHLHRIEAGAATENTRSIQVLEKCGMSREGTGRKTLPIRGEWKDHYYYAIVEDDWRS